MLAAASIGAIWSSTSPDFGINVSSLIIAGKLSLFHANEVMKWQILFTLVLLPPPGTAKYTRIFLATTNPSFQLSIMTCSFVSWVSLANSLLGYFQVEFIVFVSFYYIKCAIQQSYVGLGPSFSNPSPGCLATLQFLCISSPFLCLLCG